MATQHLCDYCGKKITDDTTSVAASVGGFYPRYELCGKCGAPIAKILTRYKLSHAPADPK